MICHIKKHDKDGIPQMDTASFASFSLPRWNELPEIDLYMDQVVSFLQMKLSAFDGIASDSPVTATMINNYVKQDLIDPPVNKKYSRSHIAKLMIIFILKKVMSIPEISDTLYCINNIVNFEEGYNTFCEKCEKSVTSLSERKQDTGREAERIIGCAVDALSHKLYAVGCTKEIKDALEKAELENSARMKKKPEKEAKAQEKQEKQDKTEKAKEPEVTEKVSCRDEGNADLSGADKE